MVTQLVHKSTDEVVQFWGVFNYLHAKLLANI